MSAHACHAPLEARILRLAADLDRTDAADHAQAQRITSALHTLAEAASDWHELYAALSPAQRVQGRRADRANAACRHDTVTERLTIVCPTCGRHCTIHCRKCGAIGG